MNILNKINQGVKEYEKDIQSMSDKELYNHVYDDYDKNDFASKVLKKRGISKCECFDELQQFGCPAKNSCIHS